MLNNYAISASRSHHRPALFDAVSSRLLPAVSFKIRDVFERSHVLVFVFNRKASSPVMSYKADFLQQKCDFRVHTSPKWGTEGTAERVFPGKTCFQDEGEPAPRF